MSSSSCAHPVPETKRLYEATPLIQASGVGVKYEQRSKREDIQSLAYEFLLRRKRKREFWALKDVDLVAAGGEIIGLIGANGAGKTTLCRVLSGVLLPDVGQVKVQGKVAAILSLAGAFNNQLSGRENMKLTGMALGHTKREIERLLPQIVDFSGLKDFVDQPLAVYSSGMKARLGFSIAVAVEPDILVVDDAVSAGDLEFSIRAGERIQEVLAKASVAILVSHQLDFVQRYCTRAVWLDKGSIRAIGSPAEIVPIYKEALLSKTRNTRSVSFVETRSQQRTHEIVTANRVGVQFTLRKERGTNSTVVRSGTWKKDRRTLWALKGVSFTAREGEIIALIGPNGAGKTTLCRVLAGALKPDEGEISTRGEITALLSLGGGFNHELIGRDNIYLNGLLLGITKNRLRSLYSDIVQFSGLTTFIEEPVKHYSSGMISRLGFSVAAVIEPDIFIIDETLSVGDVEFYERASAKMQELITRATVAIVATHNLTFVEKVCTRAIWVSGGAIKLDGNPKEVASRYRDWVKSRPKG